MTTVNSIREKLINFFPNVIESLNNDIEKFANENIKYPEEILNNNMIKFISNVIRVEIPTDLDNENSWVFLKKHKNNLIEENIKTINQTTNTDVPDFIFKNIENMASNRGYIWRHIKYFGKKPPLKTEVTVLFEPRKGRTLIHVYEKNKIKLYEKLKGKKYQRLLKVTNINENNNDNDNEKDNNIFNQLN